MKKSFLIFIAVFFVISCSGVYVNNQVKTTEIEKIYESLPGYIKTESTHFTVITDSRLDSSVYVNYLEKMYLRFMTYTNLLSFIQEKPYVVIIHKDEKEYFKNNRNWSGGSIRDTVIETYDSDNINCTLAHELAHLIFNEYMGEYANFYLWLNEGLATYMERKECSERDLFFRNIITNELKLYPLRLTSIINYAPSDNSDINFLYRYYATVSDIVRFLIENYGAYKFSIFLDNLRKGYDLDTSLRDVYYNIKNFKDLEQRWAENSGISI